MAKDVLNKSKLSEEEYNIMEKTICNEQRRPTQWHKILSFQTFLVTLLIMAGINVFMVLGGSWYNSTWDFIIVNFLSFPICYLVLAICLIYE